MCPQARIGVVPIALHDVRDAAAFVQGLMPSGLPSALNEELHAEGLRILVEMAHAYEPGRGGADPATSSFAGFASHFLRLKLGEALHRLSGETLRTLPSGRREWTAAAMCSLDALAPDGESPRAGVASAEIEADLSDRLAEALDRWWVEERGHCVAVGQALAEGVPLAHVASLLGMRKREVARYAELLERALPYLTPLAA